MAGGVQERIGARMRAQARLGAFAPAREDDPGRPRLLADSGDAVRAWPHMRHRPLVRVIRRRADHRVGKRVPDHVDGCVLQADRTRQADQQSIIAVDQGDFIGQQAPAGQHQRSGERAFPGAGIARQHDGAAVHFQHGGMQHQVMVGVAGDAPVHAPLQQGKGVVGRQGFEWRVAVEPEIDLRPQPATQAGRRADSNMKITELAAIEREIGIKPQQAFGHLGHRAVDASGEGAGAQRQFIVGKTATNLRQRQVTQFHAAGSANSRLASSSRMPVKAVLASF